MSIIRDTIYPTLKAFTPAIVSALVSVLLNTQDTRIKSVVSGIGLGLSGIQVIALSGVPAQLRSRSFNSTSFHGRSTQEKISRWALATTGCAMVVGGVYCILSGIVDLLIRPIATANEIPPPPYQAASPCQVRLAKAVTYLEKCPASNQLMNDVQPVTFICVPDDFSQKLTMSELAIWNSRDIPINENMEQVAVPMLEEMSRLQDEERIRNITDSACSLSSLEYAKQVETVKYTVHRRTYDIAENCVNNGALPRTEWRPYKEDFSEFENNSLEGYLNLPSTRARTFLYMQDRLDRCQ